MQFLLRGVQNRVEGETIKNKRFFSAFHQHQTDLKSLENTPFIAENAGGQFNRRGKQDHPLAVGGDKSRLGQAFKVLNPFAMGNIAPGGTPATEEHR